MKISFLGHSCFRLRSKQGIVIIDPFDDYVGFSLSRRKADIVCCTHQHKDHCDLSKIKGKPFLIEAPGEYEVGGIQVMGTKLYHDDKKGEKRGKITAYVVKIGGVKVCHLGDLGHELSEKQVDQIGEVDVLILPVGGEFTIGPKTAVKVMGQIEPRVVIPMHYKTKHHSDKFLKLAQLDEFLKEADMEGVTLKKDEYKVRSSSLPEETQLIILKNQSV